MGSGRNCFAEEGDVTPVFNLINLLVPPVVDQNHYLHVTEAVDLYTGTCNLKKGHKSGSRVPVFDLERAAVAGQSARVQRWY